MYEPPSYRLKVQQIFVERFGPSATPKLGLGVDDSLVDQVARSYPELPTDVAFDLAFHLSDWRADAAFLLALHLMPDEFTPEEVEDGLTDFLVHAPNHVAAAAKLAGYPITDVFEIGVLGGRDDDPGRPA